MASQLKEFGQGLIDPKFCCCAVPLVNAGIYLLMGEQAILGLAAGVMAIATPDVVGTVFPAFANYIFAITCWAVAILQPVGFIGVLREKTKTFKIYTLLNAAAVASVFVTAAALIIASALKHNDAVADCQLKYFNSNATGLTSTASAMLKSEGPLLCGPFAWADIGIMGGLWLLLLLVQGYFIYITRTYSFSQVSDHKLYHSVYSQNPEAFTMSILRSTRYNPGSVYNNMPMPPSSLHGGDAWDARPSMDSLRRSQRASYGVGGDEYGEEAGGYKYGPGGVGYGTNPMSSSSLSRGLDDTIPPNLEYQQHQHQQQDQQQHMRPPTYGHERGASYASYASSAGRYDDAYGDGNRGNSYHEPQHQQSQPQQGYEGYGASAGYPYQQQEQQEQYHYSGAPQGQYAGQQQPYNNYHNGHAGR